MALKRCCCCMPLRTGAIRIAILYLVVNIGLLIGWTAWLVWELSPNSNLDARSRQYIVRLIGSILGVLGVLCGINIAMNSLLVHGIRTNRRKLMLPWVIWYGFNTTLLSLTLIGVCMWRMALFIRYDDVGFLMMSGITALSVPVAWYWYACVVSYYWVLVQPSDSHVMESL